MRQGSPSPLPCTSALKTTATAAGRWSTRRCRFWPTRSNTVSGTSSMETMHVVGRQDRLPPAVAHQNAGREAINHSLHAQTGLRQFGLRPVARIHIEQGPDDIALGIRGVQQRPLHVEPAQATIAAAELPFSAHHALGLQPLVQGTKALEALLRAMHHPERQRLRRSVGVQPEVLRRPLVGIDHLAFIAGHQHQRTTPVQQGADQVRLVHAFLDVAVHAQHAQRAALRIPQRDLPPRFHPAPAAILLAQTHLHPKRFTLRQVLLQPRAHPGTIGGVQLLHKAVEPQNAQRLVGTPHDLVATRIPHHRVLLAIPLPQAIAHRADRQAQALLALAGVVA